MENNFALCRFRLRILTFYLLAVLCVFAPLREIKAQSLPPATQRQINAVLDAPNLKEAHIGLSILDLGTVKDASTFPAKPYLGKPYRVLFERDADKCFMPASNMKLFTAAIALELLGKERTFPTRVVKGINDGVPDLYLVGGGDPSLSSEDLKLLAEQLKRNGITSVREVHASGRLYGAETLGKRYPFGWTLDDAIWYYAPEISALAINRNQVDVTVTASQSVGQAANITFSPYYKLSPPDPILDGVVVTTHQTDGSRGQRQLDSLIFERSLAFGDVITDILWVDGTIEVGREVKEGVALPRPEYVAGVEFKGKLLEAGVLVKNDANDLAPDIFKNQLLSPLLTHNSPPLKTLFQRFLKNSDNLYAEMLLRDASYYYDGTGGDKAGPHAHQLLKKWMIEQGIDTSTLRFEDGSGLSRYNLLTPRATAQLLAAINAMKDGEVIWNALPIGGVDGTMKNRVKGTPAQNNARAKSGTFSIASNLSGYVTTRDHHRLAVSLYMNFARDGDAARAAQDQVFAALAGTTIKIATR